MEDQTIAVATHQKLHHLHQQHLADVVPVIIRNLADHFRRLRLQLFLLILSISVLSMIWLALHVYVLPSNSDDNSLFCLSTTLVFSLFTRTLDRKYMFLLCNGILAVLAKSFHFSATITTPVVVVAPDPDDTDPQVVIDVNLKPSLLEAEADGGEEDKDCGLEINEETSAAAASEVVLADNNTNDDCYYTKDESMSTEELNKKIEEFIRRMKEEIRVEAQTQLIAV